MHKQAKLYSQLCCIPHSFYLALLLPNTLFTSHYFYLALILPSTLFTALFLRSLFLPALFLPDTEVNNFF